MKTRNNYVYCVKTFVWEAGDDVDKTDAIASIVQAVIKRRNSLGITQRDLASLCGLPQSSVARFESFKTTPNIDTLLKIIKPLGLKLTVSM